MMELRESILRGQLTAAEALRRALERIGSVDPGLGAVRELDAERAMARAREIDRRIALGGEAAKAAGFLAGVPVLVKDNIVTDFGTTCCGSRMLAGYRSPYSASVVERLEQAGAIVLGKTNCDEFAMGSSTESCVYGPTRNPWDPTRVPGGSSGGSAVAVAAGMVPVALGSDTGGSIRQPAALCGVVGLKPTYGRVSRYGLVAFGSSLDVIGPFTRSVRDAAAVLEIIAGRDPRDSTSADLGVPDMLVDLDLPVENLVIGVPSQYRSESNDPAVTVAIDDAIEFFRDAGATIEPVELPLTDYGISTYYVLAPAEASSNLARYDGIRYGHRAALASGEDLEDLYARSRVEGFGPEVQRRIMLGTYVLSSGYYDAYYQRALQVRRLIGQEFAAAFERCHVLLGPTSPTPAFPLGGRNDPLSMYLCDVYTVNANIAGIPAISIPCGLAEEGGQRLPIGLQLQGRPFDESTLLRVARMFERATSWHSAACPI
jgi:aspartyl-tRNA(Asn)/glutamyl-tRNA(Gln) amidotransferase subunit A